MSTSFTRTRQEIARKVLRRYGVLASGGADNSADMEVIYEAIDLRLKSLHANGTPWRKVNETGLQFTIPALVSASVTADILFPITMTVKDGSLDEPVTIIGVREYQAIEDKGLTDDLPTKALWKGGAEFHFWPVPTASLSATLVYAAIADDSTAGTAPDVDVAMLKSLTDMVTYDCADDFMQPEGKIARFQREAAVAEMTIRKFSVQRVDFEPVRVDDFDGRNPLTRRDTDYGW